MPSQPKLASFPAIRGALKFYQICSIITGIGLLLLVAEMILKYTPIHLELFLGGSGGFLWLAPTIAGPDCLWWSLFLPMTNDCEMVPTGDGFNLSLFILVAHGWFYVVYLFSCFRIWSLMRWGFPRFLLLATGGVVPLASFFLEAATAREVRRYLATREAEEAEHLLAESERVREETQTPASPLEGRA